MTRRVSKFFKRIRRELNFSGDFLMIGYLSGTIKFFFSDGCILDAHGVGYKIFLDASTKQNLTVGEAADFFIHTAVREDAITLFGFADAATARPFLRAQLILFSSCVFASLACGRSRFFREFCAGRRIFRAISKLPFFHRVFIKEKLYALVARMSLRFPLLYGVLKFLRHDTGRKSES